MFIRREFFVPVFLALAVAASAASLPSSPTDPKHPGSLVYEYENSVEEFKCQGREVRVYLPKASGRFPVVIFGHGQALDHAPYEETFFHLARKGIAVIYPQYDTGFFDQNWQRMGRDYLALSSCALEKYRDRLNPEMVTFSGHSKGAYVASVAAGLSGRESLRPFPKALMTFAIAGDDKELFHQIPKTTVTTAVFVEDDKIVSLDFSRSLFENAGADHRQLIVVRNYPEAKAGHFWVLSKKTIFGGTAPNAYHYYGIWKWLTASSKDQVRGGNLDDPYLFGSLSSEKGIQGLSDEIERSW